MDKQPVELPWYNRKFYDDVGRVYLHRAKDCTGFGIKKDVESATNFETHVLAYISSGNKPTGGYSVVVKKVQYDTEKKALIIHAKVRNRNF